MAEEKRKKEETVSEERNRIAAALESMNKRKMELLATSESFGIVSISHET